MDPPPRFAILTPGDQITGHGRVLTAERALARTGAPFHRLTLADPAGARLPARRFAVTEPPPPAGAIVRITGVVETYRDERCLKLTGCIVDPLVRPDAFWPVIPMSRRVTPAEFGGLIQQIGDPVIRSWVLACFGSWTPEHLVTAPASVIHHGAAVGGFLAHTMRVARMALALAGLAGDVVDRDILLAAALLHDLGKLEELPPEPGTGPTDRGALLGQIVLGLLRIAQAAADIAPLASAQVDAVLHAVVAAHGRPEWGAPVVPATLEAVLLHQADRAEATLEAALTAIEEQPAGRPWTGYLPAFGTHLWVLSCVPYRGARPREATSRVDALG